jgi:hypothetical protein
LHQSGLRLFLAALALSPAAMPLCGVLLSPAAAQTRTISKRKVSGVVFDTQGQPIPNARVVLVPNTLDEEWAPPQLFRSDEAGHFAGEFNSAFPTGKAIGEDATGGAEETDPYP